MIIELKSDIFNDTDFKGLNFLIQLATYKNRYVLFTDLPSVRNLPLYKRLDTEDKEILEQTFNKVMTESLDRNYTITTNTAEDNEFNIEEAIHFFIQPISIILENSLNDAYFIQALVQHFDDKKEIKRNLDNKWAQFENAGGCSNVVNFIRGKLASFNSLPKDNHKYLRCFVLLDSDRDFEGLELDCKHKSCVSFLDSKEISFHILEKRNMENYMPDDVFEEYTKTELKNWSEAYKYLSPKQKDFINIPKGFEEKPKQNASKSDSKEKKQEKQLQGENIFFQSKEVEKLYASVSPANYNKLKKGFPLGNFKDEFPKKFTESHNVHKESLLERTKHQEDPNELYHILEKINQLL